jgi:hypothetical protein
MWWDNTDLDRHATETELRYLQAMRKSRSLREAARQCKRDRKTLSQAFSRLRKRVARVEPNTHAHEAPPGYVLRGVSTLRDDKGQVVQQWVKTKVDHEQRMQVLREALEDVVSSARRLKPLPAPKGRVEQDLLSAYPLPDAHIGLLAWAQETGADFDLRIAERV